MHVIVVFNEINFTINLTNVPKRDTILTMILAFFETSKANTILSHSNCWWYLVQKRKQKNKQAKMLGRLLLHATHIEASCVCMYDFFQKYCICILTLLQCYISRYTNTLNNKLDVLNDFIHLFFLKSIFFSWYCSLGQSLVWKTQTIKKVTIIKCTLC